MQLMALVSCSISACAFACRSSKVVRPAPHVTVLVSRKLACVAQHAWTHALLLCRKLEGGVSAVTKQITVEDKYEKQLAELDLMAEDWIDTDEARLLVLCLLGQTR